MIKLKKRDDYSETFTHIADVIEASRGRVLQAVNTEMVACYWEIGQIITERIQKHKRHADYGEALLQRLAKDLTAHYGRGFGADNLNRMRQFYQTFPIFDAVRQELSWTHYRKLLTIEDETKRNFYMEQAARGRWSSRELERQMNSILFERIAISNSAEKLIQKERALRGEPETMELLGHFKDPYVLEFLTLTDTYSERDLEAALLGNLQQFLLELGTDFAFLGRQVRIVIDDDDFYIDLLFYHRSLRCLVAIDLKLGEFTPADKGQMDLYLAYLKRYEMRAGENPPIGLILCSSKKQQRVELLLVESPHRMKVSEYLLKLPDRKLLETKLVEYSRILQEVPESTKTKKK